jgi:DNA-binding NtrC family response regulator
MTRILAAGLTRSELESALPSDVPLRCVGHADDALEALASWTPDVVLCAFPAIPAEDVERIAARTAKVSLVVDEVSSTVLGLARKIGAVSVLVAPVYRQDMRRLIAASSGSALPGPEPVDGPPAGTLIGDSAAMGEVCGLIALASRSEMNVLITGETGTGKELVARAIHALSPRRDRPFVGVSCAALPETLLESELFGHERGAFTGASAAHPGRFERAQNGTLLLDEVGELPDSMQVKLLRVLQERQIERLGGSKSIDIDVRVLAATNADLAAPSNAFRRDLLYRLNVLNIAVPPLREHIDDVDALWRHFVDLAAKSEGMTSIETSPEVSHRLNAHHWPGNVRELENVARHAVLLSHGRPILREHLPRYLREVAPKLTRVSLPVGLSLPELERELILETCRRIPSVKDAAAVLDISVRKLFYRIKEYRAKGWLDEAAAHALTPKPRIILAEDNDDVRHALTDLLTGDGYEVIAVPNALELMNHLGPDVLLKREALPGDAIVTDLRMPLMDGFQLVQSARAHGWHIPVIVISGFADDETRARAKDLGVTAFLEKPLDLQKLQEVLREALGRDVAEPAYS